MLFKIYNVKSLLYEDTQETVTTIKIMIYKENFDDNVYVNYFDCAFNRKFFNKH